MNRLDAIDCKILSELSRDGRLDQASLAKRLKLSRERVKYRLAKLRNTGVIQSFVTLINPTRLGISLYKTYFRLNSDRKTIAKLLLYLDRHPRTFWVAECAGQWDLILVVFAKTAKEYSQILDRILALSGNCILDMTVYTLTDAWYFSRGYLNGVNFDKIYVGGPGEEVPVDQLDLAILKSLASDSRLTYTQVAKINNTSLAIARSRMQRLEETGVIAYYRVELNLAAIGRWYYKAQLYFTEFDIKQEDELRRFCQHEPEITNLIKQIGSCRLEIELESQSFETYNQTIDRIRDRFGGYIRYIDTILIRKQRIVGVPMDLQTFS